MTVVTEPGVGLAAAWRLLSLGFAPPRDETLTEMEALAESLLELEWEPRTADALRAIAAAIHETDRDTLGARYQYLFGGSVRVSPYEGSYELDPIRQGRQMADVAAFYRAFGAEAHGPVAERPDHVGCELEFLAYLELRRLVVADSGSQADATILEEITASFLADHAGRWLPTFFGDTYEAAGIAPLYRALAAFGSAVVGGELERRELEPSPLPRRRPRSAVEADAIECG
ncbi:MAG: molecular chaperone TorD family protein [Gaiellaceae bacterium]